MPAAPGCRAGAENLKRCAHRLAAASGRRRLDHESFCRSGLVNTEHWCQGPPCTKIQGVYRPCESGVEPIETLECGSTKRPGEKRNDHPVSAALAFAPLLLAAAAHGQDGTQQAAQHPGRSVVMSKC